MADAADTAGSPTESSGDVVYNGLIIPAQMAALLSQGSEIRQSPVKRSEHPGAAASSTSNFCATDSAGLAKGSSKSVTTPPQNRPKVIDGVGGDSTGDHDFASPPFVCTSQRRPHSKRTVTCSNCGERGHSKKKCTKPKRDRELNALDMRPLNAAKRKRLRPEGTAASRVGDLDQPSDFDGSDGSFVCTSGNDSEEQEENERNEDEAARMQYTECVWVPHDIQEMLEPESPVSASLRSPPKQNAEMPGSLPDFASAPKYKPRVHRSHPKCIPRECDTACDYAKLFLTDEVLSILVTHTNLAAITHPRLLSKRRFQNWKPTTAKEMLCFIGLCAFLGVVKVQNRKHVWSKSSIYRQKWLSKRMSLRRFESIITALNVADGWSLSDHRLSKKNKERPFWQMDDILRMFNVASKKYWSMGRLMSLDEAVIPFKGRHRARCYNKNKPSKYHLKKFGLMCAKTGYNYCSYFYEGKGEMRGRVAASTWPIMRLLDACPELHDDNRVLAVDNWFSSAASLGECARKGISFVGTMRPGRLQLESAKGRGTFPLAGVLRAAGVAKAKRGDYCCHKTTFENPPVTHYVTAWQDKQPVYVLSSYPPHVGRCVRKIRQDGVWTAQTFERPTTVQDYNSAMGGTDLHDMRLALLRTTVKSRRWQVLVFATLKT